MLAPRNKQYVVPIRFALPGCRVLQVCSCDAEKLRKKALAAQKTQPAVVATSLVGSMLLLVLLGSAGLQCTKASEGSAKEATHKDTELSGVCIIRAVQCFVLCLIRGPSPIRVCCCFILCCQLLVCRHPGSDFFSGLDYWCLVPFAVAS